MNYRSYSYNLKLRFYKKEGLDMVTNIIISDNPISRTRYCKQIEDLPMITKRNTSRSIGSNCWVYEKSVGKRMFNFNIHF